MAVEKRFFGKLSDGREVFEFTLTDSEGNMAVVINYGAILRSLFIKAADGAFRDVVIGCDTAEEYERQTVCLGSTMGRCTTRIAGAAFTLSGQEYHVSENRSGFQIHGGFEGFDKKLWDYSVEENMVTFSYISPDGEEGYPGRLLARVSYYWESAGVLCVGYDAVSDRETVVNLTNHSYFNLDGFDGEDAMKQRLWLGSSVMAHFDENSTPDGEFMDVAGTALDFTREHPICQTIGADDPCLKQVKGYDFNYLFDAEGMKDIARLTSDKSGISMLVKSDIYDVGLYTANFLGNIKGKGGYMHKCYDGVCLETQFLPNAVNLEAALHKPVFKAGEHFKFTTKFCFSV